MRFLLQIITVLECARFAFVGVDRHQPGAAITAHKLPFFTGRKTCPTQTAQRGIQHGLNQIIALGGIVQAALQGAVAAFGTICIQCLISRQHRMDVFIGDRIADAGDAGMIDMPMADFGNRCHITAAHTGRPQHTDFIAQCSRQLLEQFLRTVELAAETVADPHRERFERLGFIQHDIEMRVKGCDFIDFCQGQAHFLGQCGQMICA